MKVEIIADSINQNGCRLTTYVLEFQRFILAELATHRVFSKSAASSRALPIEKVIEAITTNPALPVKWGSHKAGMGSGDELDDVILNQEWLDGMNSFGKISTKECAKRTWLEARDHAILFAKKLNDLGLHKSITNRIMEPWFNIRIILSGTEFENFFALRAHSDAQPELQALAFQMLEEYNKSAPKLLKDGEWHVPFGDKFDESRLWDLVNRDEEDTLDEPASVYFGTNTAGFEEVKRKVAVARCARISYYNFEGKDDYEADVKLCDRLFGSIPRHLGPTEHIAQSMPDDKFIGNFRGFKQFRYTFEDQNLTDSRVLKK